MKLSQKLLLFFLLSHLISLCPPFCTCTYNPALTGLTLIPCTPCDPNITLCYSSWYGLIMWCWPHRYNSTALSLTPCPCSSTFPWLLSHAIVSILVYKTSASPVYSPVWPLESIKALLHIELLVNNHQPTPIVTLNPRTPRTLLNVLLILCPLDSAHFPTCMDASLIITKHQHNLKLLSSAHEWP